MSRFNFLFILLFSYLLSETQWINISSESIDNPDVQIISSSDNTVELNFSLDDFYLESIVIDNQEYFKVKIPGGASILEKGLPDLPKYSKSIIIPNEKKMKVEVINESYVEYENILIAPSKGNFSRLIDPQTVSYEFSKTYNKNIFFPENNVQLNTPYIIRDFRGQVVQFNPIQYNPTTKVLRVYNSISVQVIADGIDSININTRNENITKIDKEYKSIYENHFLNFDFNDMRFDYLVDHGRMLVISYGDFIDEMQPLVDWKNLKGIPTEIIDVNDIGSSSSSITAFVQNYYNDTGLTFLLLVGDIAQIPSPLVSGSASDMSYGCISGSDYYPEVIVGRISGSNPSQISTQVERSIEYERYPQANVEWYDNALGVASNQGPGYNGMMDDEFSQYLWDAVLSDFTYDDYQGIYDPNGSDSEGIAAINNGVSLINYTGHGSISSWGNGASLNTSQINQLTNDNKLPFVITVGCNVGEFNSTDECYAEAWMRATNNGEPTGSIAHFGSTISQSWTPPMHGQYAMNLIITESYDEHLTRTLGGITANGCMYMNDAQGSSGINETKYWTFFGDPSTNIRTAPATVMNVIHDDVILIDQEEFVVDVGEDGALIAISRDGELLSSAYSVGGVAILDLGDAASEPGDLDLVVTGFNSFPYETEVMVISPEGAFVVIDDVEVGYGSVESGHLLYGWENNLNLSLSNVGTDNASDVTVAISSDNEYLSVIQGTANYSNIGSNQSVVVEGLNVNLDWNVPNGEIINIMFNISSGDNVWESTIPFIAQAPEISLDSVVGNLDTGEDALLEISLSNIGSAAINYPIVSLEGDMYVTVNNSGIENAYYWDYMYDYQEVLYANVTVSPTAPVGHVAELMIYVTNLNGGLDISIPISFSVGQITENFESGFSEPLNWEFSGNADWEITTTDQYEGFYSAKSGIIDNSQTSSMEVTLDVVIDGTIDFYYRVASEYSPSGLYFYDGLEFYIDNQMVGQYQPTQEGQTPWTYASFPIESGTHTFKWSYVKDGGGGSTDMEEDCAWVDYIIFPPSSLNDDGGMLGDITGDGEINVQDIVMMINMVIGNSDVNPLADINFDGTVDVLDIILVVNIILGS